MGGPGLLVAVVLAYSGASKLRNPSGFASKVAGYGLVPPQMVRTAAFGVIAIEIAVPLGAPFYPEFAFAIAAVLFGAYLVAQSIVLAAGRTVDCGCLGSRGGPLDTIGYASLTRTGLLALAALAASLIPPRLDGLTTIAYDVLIGLLLLVFILTATELTRLVTDLRLKAGHLVPSLHGTLAAGGRR